MSSTAVLGFMKDISTGNVKAVRDRLKAAQGPNQRYTDPKELNLTYALLHKAVETGCPEVITALVAAGADVNVADSRGRTPLHWIASSVVEHAVNTAALLLATQGINIHATSNTKATALHEAAAAGNTAILQLLLSHGARPLDTSPGFSALHAACMGTCSLLPATACTEVPLAAGCASATRSEKPPQSEDSGNQTQLQAQQGNTAGQLAADLAQHPAASVVNDKTRSLQQQLRPKPPAVKQNKAQPASAPPRPTAGKLLVRPARTAVTPAAKPPAAAPIKETVNTGPTGASSARAPAATAQSPAPAAATPVDVSRQAVNLQAVDVLLKASLGLLAAQDSDGFTPLMRLLQRGHSSDAQLLLERGDCNVNAMAFSTGDAALHIACSCRQPDLQLVSALMAAGARPTAPRTSDGNTPLHLAVKTAGQAGLALAKSMLQPGLPCAGQQGSLWCPLSLACDDAADGRNSSGLETANTAGETPVGLAAAAVLGALADIPQGSAGSVAAPAAAGSFGAQQDLLDLLLSQGPQLQPELAGTLLQQGLTGRLSDRLTAQVVACMPDAVRLTAAAASAAAPAATSSSVKVEQMSYEGFLEAGMYRTAVAWHSKASGKQPCEDLDAAGNTLLHVAVSGSSDQPGFVMALVEAPGGVPVNAVNHDHDTPLHVAARQGHLEACRALVAAGADVLRRNGKNRAPGQQLKLPEPVKIYLQQAEEEARCAKNEQMHALWDDKMRATQTQSAFGIRVT